MKMFAILGAFFALIFSGDGQAQQIRSFKDWWVMCDIQRTCTILTGDDLTGRFLRLRRAGQVGSPLRDETLTQIGDRRGDPRAVIPPRYREAPGTPRENLLQWLTSINEKIGLPLDGALEALSWMDEYQGRAGRPSALLLKGSQPEPDREIPEAKSLAPVATPSLPAPETPPDALVALVETPSVCGSEFDPTDPADRRYESMRLSENKVIWLVLCEETGFYQDVSYFYDDNGQISPALITMPNFDGSTAVENSNSLPSSGFDPQNLTITMQGFGSRMLDCSQLIVWQWNGTEFEIMSYAIVPICGIPVESGPDLLMPDPGEPNPWGDDLDE